MYKINHINGDCVESDNTVEGAVPAIGPEGQIYNKSNDQGTTWKEEETKIDPMRTGWDYAISGIYIANGLPMKVCDLSDGPHRGTIYVNWTDQRNGSNDTDVWLSKSTDLGTT